MRARVFLAETGRPEWRQMQVVLVNSSKVRMPRKFIHKWIVSTRQVLRRKGVNIGTTTELTIVFLDKGAAKKINFRYRKKNYPTDVLSFDGDGQLSMGELILCPQIIERQAKQHHLSFREELGYLLLHGILHLLGYEHERSYREAELMFQLQDKAFDQLCRKFWK